MCLIHDLKSKFVRFKLSNRNLATISKIKKFQRQLLLSEYLGKRKQAKKIKKRIRRNEKRRSTVFILCILSDEIEELFFLN